MKAINAYFFTSISHLARIAVAFLVTKMIAYHLGPEGMGALGNFMTLSSALYILSGGGILAGVINQVAKFRENTDHLERFVNAALNYSLAFSSSIFILFLIFQNSINQIVFGDTSKAEILYILFLAQFFYSVVNLIVGYINGTGNTKIYSTVVITGNIAAVPFIYYFIKYHNFLGAAVSVLLPNILTFIPAIYFAYKLNIFKKIKIGYDRAIKGILLKFSIMTICSATLYPSAEILVRNLLIENVGLAETGLYQGLLKLSGVYISFMTTFLSFYFLPQISAAANVAETKQIMRKTLFMIWGLFIFGAVTLLLLSKPVISIALSSEFLGVDKYLIYQLVADCLKITGYVFGFLILSKVSIKRTIIIELIQAAAFFGFSYLFVHQLQNLQAVYWANILGSSVYLLTVVILSLTYLRPTKESQHV